MAHLFDKVLLPNMPKSTLGGAVVVVTPASKAAALAATPAAKNRINRRFQIVDGHLLILFLEK